VGLDDQPEEAMRVALALAEASSHPLAEALSTALRAKGLRPARVEGVAAKRRATAWKGTWRGQSVRLGRAAWVGAEAPDVTATFLKIGDDAPLPIRFTDTLREGAAETVAALKATGRRVILMSGDTRGAVEAFATRIGIEEVIAEALPQEKAALVADLAEGGAKVLMVGDGLNDTAALAAAHVSISPASALDAARTASDMVLMGRSLAPIADAYDLHIRGAAHPRELHHRHGLQRSGRAAGHRGARHAADRRLGDVDVFHYGLAQRIAVEVSLPWTSSVS
jgi:Cu2+-exporting ATPase